MKKLFICLLLFSCNVQEKQTCEYKVRNLSNNKLDIIEYRKGYSINDTIYKTTINRYENKVDTLKIIKILN